MQYANVDGWSRRDPRPAVSERPELDRWVLSPLQTLIASVDLERGPVSGESLSLSSVQGEHAVRLKIQAI